jgi:hypothetical protein
MSILETTRDTRRPEISSEHELTVHASLRSEWKENRRLSGRPGGMPAHRPPRPTAPRVCGSAEDHPGEGVVVRPVRGDTYEILLRTRPRGDLPARCFEVLSQNGVRLDRFGIMREMGDAAGVLVTIVTRDCSRESADAVARDLHDS